MPLYVELKQAVLRQYYRRSYMFQRLPMNQRLLIVLFPVFLVFGLFMIYRSYQSSDFSIGMNVSDRPVRVDFFVMSKCPDARQCETLFASSLLTLSPIVNFTVSFIAYGSKPNEIECMHGPDECLGNKQQLCVQDMCSQTTLIKFLQCQSRELHSIPNNAEKCVNEASDGTLKWSDVDQCVKSSRGNDLFYKSLEKTRAASARKSCTIHLNGKFWCMHDGSWYGCTEGHDKQSLIKAICSRYNGATKLTECSAYSS